MAYINGVKQFEKIRRLVKEFEKFEQKTEEYYEPIQTYLDTINSFLSDSSKELYFEESTSKLRYRIFNDKNEVVDKNRDIEALSSGEKQILILFTYIRFSENSGNIFIIDEPELSLHPRWQENFMGAIKKVLPSNTQLLFATHSPSIVGNNKEFTTTLMPY